MTTQNKRNWYRIDNKATETADAEIYLYDQIGIGWDGAGIPADKFVEELNALGSPKRLNLYINSPGGSVMDGVAIHTALERQKSTINVHIDGIAASISSLIAMAGDTINIAENGMMLVHNAWTMAVGNAEDLRKQAADLERIDSMLVSAYDKQTGLGREKIASLMREDRLMMAQEAVDLGFADQLNAPVQAAAMTFDLSGVKGVPAAILKALATVKPGAAAAPEPPSLAARIADFEHWLSKNRRQHAKK